MPTDVVKRVLVLAAVIAAAASAYPRHANMAPSSQVTILRTPNDGIQPETAVDAEGVLHMIYFVGDARGGDIEYVSRRSGAKDFSTPIRVNSTPQSAIVVGTVRGPQMALGRNGQVYVAWIGPQPTPSAPGMAYFSRLNPAGTAFEPQRALVQYSQGRDGISVAADRRGDVYAVWHAMGTQPGENNRRVYMTRSTDDGKTFAREVPISPAELGACGCCGLRAFADNRGTFFVIYRAAAQTVHRDMTLLTSDDQGETFQSKKLAAWQLDACPMSTEFLSEGGRHVLAAWETAGQVYFDSVNADSLETSSAISAPGDATNRKHPAVAASANGETLFVWAEDTGWSKGGSLAWQLFDQTGKPTGAEGHAVGVPVWSLPSAFADKQENFTILY